MVSLRPILFDLDVVKDLWRLFLEEYLSKQDITYPKIGNNLSISVGQGITAHPFFMGYHHSPSIIPK